METIEEYAEKYPFYPFKSNRGSEVIAVEDDCAVVKMTHLEFRPAFLNGYCVVPAADMPPQYLVEGHYGLPYMEVPCDVHGGLTYGEREGDYVVFGFDTNHLGDENRPQLLDSAFIMAEAKRMRAQIMEVAKAANNPTERVGRSSIPRLEPANVE